MPGTWSLGIDVGASATKAVLLDDGGQVVGDYAELFSLRVALDP